MIFDPWKKAALTALVILAAAVQLTGCTPERDPGSLFAPEGVGVLVIDALLIVDQPLPGLWLTRTQAPGVAFDLATAGVTGADVVMIPPDGPDIIYRGSPEYPGLYRPFLISPHRVEPGAVYELRVATDEGEDLTARTMTPQRIEVANWVVLANDGVTVESNLRTFPELGDDTYYAPENRLTYLEGVLEARFPEPDQLLAGGGGFMLAIFSLDLGSDYLIDPAFFEEDDFQDLDRTGISPAVEADEGTTRLPWFTIFFEGRHKFKVFAVDRNWFDYLRSVPEAEIGLAFGGNVGDGFASPLFHVDGGIGLFGSAAVDSIGFFVEPPP